MDIKTLQILAQKFENELREYRLSGDLQWLLPLFQEAFIAQTDFDKEGFFKALTDTELIVFKSIRKEIGLEGNISIVKMIQKTNISRPVFTSLLQKMEKFGIARIKNQGVKGTYIEISKKVEND